MTIARCPRCQGWLMLEQLEETEEGAYRCGRCVNCGWRVDPVMAAHRLLPGPPAPYGDANTPVWDPVGAGQRMQQRIQQARAVGPVRARATKTKRPR